MLNILALAGKPSPRNRIEYAGCAGGCPATPEPDVDPCTGEPTKPTSKRKGTKRGSK